MNRIFIEVMNNALTASLVIAAILVVRLLIKSAPKWISCALWGLAGLRLLFPFRIESVLSLIPSAAPIPADIESLGTPYVEFGVPAINNIVNPVLETNFAPQPSAPVNPLSGLISICAVLWIVGMTGLFLYAVVSGLILRKKVAASKKIFENVFVCDEVAGPFILGIVRPRIYLPSGLSKETRECVMEHEKAHLKRRDYLWKPLGFFVLAVYWFNPLCWVAYVLLCKDIELACDEKVIRNKDKNWKAVYCQALLDCNVQRRMIAACPVTFGEVSIKNRVKSVLFYKKPTFWILLAAAVAVVVVTVCFMTNPKSKTEVSKILTLEKLNELCNSPDWADTQYREGISCWEQFENLERDEVFDAGSLTNLYTWDFEYEGENFELAVTYWPEESAKKYGHFSDSIKNVVLRNLKTQDCLLLYEERGGGTGADVMAFVAKTYNDFKNVPLLLERNQNLGADTPITLGEYDVDMFLNFSGRLFECGEYTEPRHGAGAPKSWYALGGIGECEREDYEQQAVFENGRLTEYIWLGNHMWSEKVGEVTDVGESGYSGCIYKYGLELFTASDLEYGTSEYWVIFLNKGEGEPIYVEFFNCDYFSVDNVL